MAERRLDDGAGARAHCRAGRLEALLRQSLARHVRDDEPTLAQRLDEHALVLEAARPQRVEELRLRGRRPQLSLRHREIERRQVRADQVVGEVGRGETKSAVGEFHGNWLIAEASL